MKVIMMKLELMRDGKQYRRCQEKTAELKAQLLQLESAAANNDFTETVADHNRAIEVIVSQNRARKHGTHGS